MKRLGVIGAACGLCAALSILCILYVDRPVELFVHGRQHFRIFYQILAAPSLLSLPMALTYLTGYAITAPFDGPPGPKTRTCLALSAAVLAATALKDELKWAFGRPWPESWMKDGLYYFKPFTDNQLYGGFPSGHTAYIAAPLLTLCWLYPKYRATCLSIIAAVMFGLVAAGYHYPADVIAGLFTGLAAAAGTVAFLRVSEQGQGALPPGPPPRDDPLEPNPVKEERGLTRTGV